MDLSLVPVRGKLLGLKALYASVCCKDHFDVTGVLSERQHVGMEG